MPGSVEVSKEAVKRSRASSAESCKTQRGSPVDDPDDLHKVRKRDAARPKIGDDGLVCLCQQPYHGEALVLCCRCKEWYHPKCTGLSKTVDMETFVCCTCKKLEDIMRARKGAVDQVAETTANASSATATTTTAAPAVIEQADDSNLADPFSLLEAAVSQMLRSGATTLRQLCSLEKSAAIPWERMQQKGRHWKRDAIRAAYLKCHETKSDESPPLKPASLPRSEVARLGVHTVQLHLHTKTARSTKETMRQTRATTQGARFVGEHRQAPSEDEMEDEEEEVEGSLHCLCRKTWDGSFMVRCDGCRIWFHPRCMGLTRQDCDHPGKFFCPKCWRRQ